jgi:iron complex outermembrane receptor protein
VTSYAGYGQFDFSVTEKLNISFGARYTHERKRVARTISIQAQDLDRIQEQVTINRGRRLNDFEFSERFGRWSPSASVSYRFSPDFNLYATWGRGFKSGGFNGRGVGDAGEKTSYSEEIVTSYEVGIKTRLFDAITFNAAYFHTIYSDIQLIQLQIQESGRIIVTTDNVGSAAINGFEFNLRASPFQGFFLNINGGILSARYEKIQNDRGAGFIRLVDPNNRLAGTPNYTATANASYVTPIGNLGDVRTTLTWSHRGKKFNNGSNSNASNKRGLLSMRMALELPDGKTRVSLTGSNLLNREFIANGINVVRNQLNFFGAPRTFGVEITREF